MLAVNRSHFSSTILGVLGTVNPSTAVDSGFAPRQCATFFPVQFRERRWRPIGRRTVRPLVMVHAGGTSPALLAHCRAMKTQTLGAQASIELSMNPSSTGRPGRMKHNRTSFAIAAHYLLFRVTNLEHRHRLLSRTSGPAYL